MTRFALSFDAPMPPMSVNEANRLHWSKRRASSAVWRDAAYYYARQAKLAQRVKKQRCSVRVYLPFMTVRRRDPHNYVGTTVKAIIDGLVLAKVWPDDTPQFVEVIEPRIINGSAAHVELETTDQS